MLLKKVCRDCQHDFLTVYSRRLYCCTRCRRHYQDERRKLERAEAREAREAGRHPMTDPWARCDLDEWTAEEIYANALLDPAPVCDEAEALAGPLVTAGPKRRKSWKDRWLWLC